MAHTISNTDDVIDSRDFIARLEELRDERDAHDAKVAEDRQAETGCTGEEAEAYAASIIGGPDDGYKDEREELAKMEIFADEMSGSPDWTHGETLIAESYFTKYIEELIDDCYEMPKEMKSGNWPWRHVTIDYEAAAGEAKQDYIEADWDGNTFLIRA